MRPILPTIFASALALAGIAPAARAADPQPYKVDLAATGDAAMDSALRATSDLLSLRSAAPVSPYGLIARARGDLDRLKTVLESYGYYQSSVRIQIDGQALNAPGLGEQLAALPKKQDARVEVRFTLGPLYHIGRISIDGTLPDSARGALPLKTGDPAVAARVLGAGTKLLAVLADQGYAFAKVDPPVAYEDKTEPLLDVTFHVETGPKLKIGRISFRGLRQVHEAVVRRRLLLHTGEAYSASAVERARSDLLKLGVFSAVSVEVGSAVDDTGGVPLAFRVRERLRYAINVNAAYSTDLGGSGGVTWGDRNVFGNAEQLDVTTSLINVGGSSTNGLGYDANVKYTLQDFGHRDQSLQLSAGAVKQYLDAYDQTATTTGVALVRKIDRQWTASAGVSTVNERIIEVVGVQDVPCTDADQADCPTPPPTEPLTHAYYYTLVQLPFSVSYDSTDLAQPLDDPTHGMRDSLSVTPTHALGASNATFLVDTIRVAGYFDLDHLLPTGAGRSVLAARALVGVAEGAGECNLLPDPHVNAAAGGCRLPPDQRFYGGGSASIRGYPYQAVGPYFPGTSFPTGGTALVAGGVEFRQRLGRDFGAALFADAGQVSSKLNLLPSNFFVGIGAGVRYYTPIGPIRLDFAVPTKHYAPAGFSEQGFQVYIGLGQAF